MSIVRKPNITHATIVGRIYCNGEDYQRLVLLARKYREKVMKAVKMLAKGLSNEYIER